MYGDWRLIRSWNSPSVIVTSSILASTALSSSALCGGAPGAPGAAGGGLDAWSSFFWQLASARTRIRNRIVTIGSRSTSEHVQQGPSRGCDRRLALGDARRDPAIRQAAPPRADRRRAEVADVGEGDRDPRRADLECECAGAPRDRLDRHQLAEQHDVAG